MSDVALLSAIKTNFSKVISGECEWPKAHLLTNRPIYRLDSACGSPQFVAKLSRLPAELLDIQLKCVNALADRCDFIPRNFGMSIDDRGRLFEIWEWINQAPRGAGRLATLRDDLWNKFRTFTIQAKSIELNNVVFPNDFSLLSEKLAIFLNSNDAEQWCDIDSDSRAVFSKASRRISDLRFAAALSQMPRSFIHTDIRDDNIRGRYLLDFSNSKYDIRILEVARFININFNHSDLTKQIASQPWLAFGDNEKALTSAEYEFFGHILYVDFACIFHWCREQISLQGTRERWARSFVQCAPKHIARML